MNECNQRQVRFFNHEYDSRPTLEDTKSNYHISQLSIAISEETVNSAQMLDQLS